MGRKGLKALKAHKALKGCLALRGRKGLRGLKERRHRQEGSSVGRRTTDDGDPDEGFPRLFNAPNGTVIEEQNQYPVPYNCTISQLTCRSTKGNVAANTGFTVRKATTPGAGTNQTLTATILAGASLATDNVNSFAANQGDMISITNTDAIGAGEWIVCSVRLTPT